MREVSRQLDGARAEYRSIRYPGDLSRELLEEHRRRIMVFALRWGTPAVGIAAAAAAAVAIAVWVHRPARSVTPLVQNGPSSATSAPSLRPAYAQTFEAIRSVPVSAYVMDVRSGMRQAVDQIALGMDGAVESPVVKGSVQTVRQLTGEIEEAMRPIGERLKPRFD